jgi:serine/threonine protein kinase/TolB-like protein
MVGDSRLDSLGATKVSEIEISDSDVLESDTVRYGGRYELRSLVGAGAYGSVYRAQDVELEEIVAIKVLRPDQLAQPNALQRFRQEVRLARRVAHPNVARTYDIGRHLGELFLTMEYIEGQPLTALCASPGKPCQPLPESVVRDIFGQLCAGLSALHQAGIVHQDMKTDNVLVSRDGRVAITDFGIARALSDLERGLDASSPICGTPAYMAPEQARGHGRIDTRADLYALGVMLFQLLTGRFPFAGGSGMEMALARLYEAPLDPRQLRRDLSSGLCDVVLRCLQREPGDRYQTAAELATALQGLALGGPSLSAHLSLVMARREQGLAAAGDLSTISASADTALLRPGLTPSGEETAGTPQGMMGGTPGLSAPHSMAGLRELPLAVLVFRHSGEGGSDYQAYGLTEAVIDQLSESAGLRVMTFGAVRSLPPSERDPGLIGRQLLVKVVVDGSLRRSEGGYEATVRLIDVDSRLQFALRRYERADGNLLLLASDIARGIAKLVTVAREAPTVQTDQMLSDPEAMDLYLRARHEYHRMTTTAAERSVQLYQRALARQPQDATLLTGYAMALARSSFFTDVAAVRESVVVAEQAVRSAPQLAEPYLALATAQVQLGELPQAAITLRRSLGRSPQLSEAQELVGLLLGETGPVDLSIRYINAARLTGGSAPRVLYILARALALSGQVEAAFSTLDLKRLDASFVRLAVTATCRLLAWLQDYDRARALLAHPLLGQAAFAEQRARLLWLLGEREMPIAEVLPAFYQRTNLSQRAKVFAKQLLIEHACIEQRPQDAIALLGEGADLGMIDIAWLDLCPLLRRLREQPEFAAVRRRVAENARAVQSAFGLPEEAWAPLEPEAVLKNAATSQAR